MGGRARVAGDGRRYLKAVSDYQAVKAGDLLVQLRDWLASGLHANHRAGGGIVSERKYVLDNWSVQALR